MDFISLKERRLSIMGGILDFKCMKSIKSIELLI